MFILLIKIKMKKTIKLSSILLLLYSIWQSFVTYSYNHQFYLDDNCWSDCFVTCDARFTNNDSVEYQVNGGDRKFIMNIYWDIMFFYNPTTMFFGLTNNKFKVNDYNARKWNSIPTTNGSNYTTEDGNNRIFFATDGTVYSYQYMVYDGWQAWCSDDWWGNNLWNPFNKYEYYK